MFGLASPAPATASAQATLSTLPGLDAVTYGQIAAYSARIENTGNVTLKNVTLHNPIPTTEVDGQPQQAIFQSAGCTGSLSATEFSCVVSDKLKAGESLSVTVAWRTPSQGSSPDCPSDGPCMTNTIFWEAGPGVPKTYAADPASASFISQDDPSQAATYTIAPCTNPASPTLATDPNLGTGNPLSTSVCAPSLPLNAPGLVTSIEERDSEESDPGITQVSDICLPSPGTACDVNPFVFSPLATFTFVIDNASLGGDTIDTVYHNGVVVSTSRRADPRVVKIKNEKFKGITTVVVESSRNGQWQFG
jgi:hypothetical protein